MRDLRGHFAGGFAINWIGIGALERHLKSIPHDVQEGMKEGARSLAEEIEAWAKDNAPWEDRTGDAREGLHAVVMQNKRDEVSIVLAHEVEYGPYLENVGGGMYAIILPTMEHFADQVGARVFYPGMNKVMNS